MINKGLFTSKTDLWETPQELFDKMNDEFGFETDVCAIQENAKCKNFYTPEENGLLQDWRGCCWMNPPYGRKIGDWVQKAYESSVNNKATVVCLLPARTDTKWFHDYCVKGEIRFLKGRLKFGGSKNSAPFPSMLVIFNAKHWEKAMLRVKGDK